MQKMVQWQQWKYQYTLSPLVQLWRAKAGLELVYLHTETLKYRNLDKFKILNTYDQKPKNVLSHKKVSFKATYKTHTKRRRINRWQTKGSQNLKSDISLKFKSLI